MDSPKVKLLTGDALQHEIEAIEAHDYDAAVAKVIAERVKIADVRSAPLLPHAEVFAASRARLMARLAGENDA
jgi:hypothetical protein